MEILAGASIFNAEGKILLLQQKEDGDQPFLWGPPAGHGNENEDPKDTAIRETKEETNLDIELTNFVQAGIVHMFDGRKYLFVTYKGRAKNLNLLKVDPVEVKELGWFSLDDIRSDSVKLRAEFLKEPILRSFLDKLGDLDSFAEYQYTKEEAEKTV